MGTDISGWVEVNPFPENGYWSGVIKLRTGVFSERAYELWGYLFGLWRRKRFTPLAPQRGMPQDVSSWVKEEYEGDVASFPGEFHSLTWITWTEIQSVSWEERIEDRVREYTREHSDRVINEWWKDWFLQYYADRWPDNPNELTAGCVWEHKGVRYEVIPTTKRDLWSGEWDTLYRILELLAQRYGAQHVRFVVWFDD